MADKVKRSNTFNINDLDGDATDDFFGSFNPSGKVTVASKLKTSLGKVKLNADIVPKADGKPLGKFSTNSAIETTIDGNPAIFKFKKTGINSHFDLGVQTIAPGVAFLNPYVVIDTPSAFKDLNKESKTTFGTVLHCYNPRFPAVMNLNLTHSNKGGKLGLDTKFNASVSHLDFKASFKNNYSLTTGDLKAQELLFGYEKGNTSAHLRMTQGPALGSLATLEVGLLQKMSDKVKIAGKFSKDADKNMSHRFGAEYKHCTGLSGKFALSDMKAASLFVKLNPCKNFETSLSLERGLDSAAELKYGVNVTYNL
jgi:hypothetical protein